MPIARHWKLSLEIVILSKNDQPQIMTIVIGWCNVSLALFNNPVNKKL